MNETIEDAYTLLQLGALQRPPEPAAGRWALTAHSVLTRGEDSSGGSSPELDDVMAPANPPYPSSPDPSSPDPFFPDPFFPDLFSSDRGKVSASSVKLACTASYAAVVIFPSW
jgi:hypothetical protein